MKRLLAIGLTLFLLLALTACGSKSSDADTPPADDTLQETGGGDVQTPVEPQQPDTPAAPGTSDTPDTSDTSDTSDPRQPAEDAQQPAQKPAETPAEKPAEKPADKPVEKPADKPEDNSPPPAQPDQPTEEAPSPSGNALSILTAVWGTYSEEEKFPAGDGPMAMDISTPDNYTYMLTFPAADTGLIDEAAGLVHMMNLNTFTCGAFHAADSKDLSTLAGDLHTAVTGKQWMCGFPDKLVIVTVDQCVLSLYGQEELVNTFRDKLTAAYPAASVVYDEAIAF